MTEDERLTRLDVNEFLRLCDQAGERAVRVGMDEATPDALLGDSPD